MGWVTDECNCSATVQFEEMKNDVKQAVTERNNLLGREVFRVTDGGNHFFSVARVSDTSVVVFKQEQGCISISGANVGQPWEVYPYLDLNRNCRFNLKPDPKHGPLTREQVIRLTLGAWLLR